MYKKFILPISLSLLFILSGCGESTPSETTSSTQNSTSTQTDDTCADIPVVNLTAATRSLNDSQDFSSSLLNSSKQLVSLSNSLIKAGTTANTEYINAMLQLSKDIGTMADKIGDMADKILVMSDDIGEMADKIVETQKIQNENVKLTQANILKAQANFNSLLK